MAASRPRYVVDASAWIDFHQGGLYQAVHRLEWDWLAPDFILRELKSPDLPQLMANGLQETELSGSQVSELVALRARYSRPSFADLSALALAKTLKLTLITGDGDLRKAAEREGVSVHGVLWLLDEMVLRQVLLPKEAAEALEKMRRRGARLPAEECNARLRKWR